MSDEREVREGPGAGTVVLAFLAGAVVGAAVALLLAPRSGAETRERLAGAAGDRARRARESARLAADAAAKALQDALRPPAPPSA